MKRASSYLCLVGFLLTSACHKSAPNGQAPEIARAPYLQLATADSIYIVWRTDVATTPAVHYGTNLAQLDRSVGGEAILTRVSMSVDPAVNTNSPRLDSAAKGNYQYEAHLTGLLPFTRYFYAVYDGDKRLAGGDDSYHFQTHPAIGSARAMRFWVVGDSGDGGRSQADVHRAMVNWSVSEKRPIDFSLHLGDIAYSHGTEREFQEHFFAMYESTLRNTVMWPTLGNHEGVNSHGDTGVGPYFDAFVLPTRGEAGGVASGTEAFYSFDFGRAHFISLDSHDLNRSPDGAMAKWLKADLAHTKADWLIAYWHHAPYTKGSHDSDRQPRLVEMRTQIMPLLEAGGVDLVLSGHSHIYERSMLMDGAYATPTVSANVILDDGDGDPNGSGPYHKSAGLHPHEGTVQVVAGNGGANLHRLGTMPVMRKTILQHGSVMVDIQGDTLSGLMLNEKGEQLDAFSIVKRGNVTPTRIAKPWQPPYLKPPKSSRKKTDDDD